MPTFINPKRATIETGSSGGLVVALAAIAVIIGAGTAAVSFLIREAEAYRVELAVGACALFALAGSVAALMAWSVRRGRPQVEAQMAAGLAAIAADRAAAALPRGDVHHHVHYEDHTHHHYDERQLHLTTSGDNLQAPAAAEAQPAIADQKVVPGVVLGAEPAAITARKAAPAHERRVPARLPWRSRRGQ